MTEVEETEEPLGFLARLWGGLWALTALVVLLTYWQQPYYLTLLSAFRFQMLWVLLAVSVPPLFVFPGKRKLLFVAVPLMFGLSFASYLLPTGRTPAAGDSVTLVTANLYAGNRNLVRLQDWLEQNPTEIVGVLELSGLHQEAIQRLGYEYTLLEPRQDAFGLGLLSRKTPLRAEILGAQSRFPALFAEFETFQVVLAHPPPPVNAKLRELGDRQLEELLRFLESSEKPTVFMGDLNATGWDFRVLPLKENGYKDARQGHGLLPTWPVGNSLLQIPIDHIFVPRTWTVHDCGVGPDIGSDHFPLRAVVTPG